MRWLLAVLFFLPLTAGAAVLAIGQAPDKSLTVTLTDDKCSLTLPPEIAKLLTRGAIWQEKGQKQHKGCWGYHPQSAEHIVIVWDDNTHTVVNRGEFKWGISG